MIPFLVLVDGLLPVGKSFSGEDFFNCGRKFFPQMQAICLLPFPSSITYNINTFLSLSLHCNVVISPTLVLHFWSIITFLFAQLQPHFSKLISLLIKIFY